MHETEPYKPTPTALTATLIADVFVSSFNQLAFDVHSTAVAKGWWKSEEADTLRDNLRVHAETTDAVSLGNASWLYDLADKLDRRNDGEMLALVHSEISEALEALRGKGADGGLLPDDKIPAFAGVEAELADAIIRIMDLAHARGWRVAEALIAKMEMNKSRSYKHGGKAF